MTITILDHELPYDTHNLYDVNFFGQNIHTLLTHSPSFVDSWIAETIQAAPPHHLVGLDVEWRPNFSPSSHNPVAVLQLCMEQRCLIFQIKHAPFIPQSLTNFLGDKSFAFVGVGIAEDAEKLLLDYGLSVGNAVDLRSVAAEVMGVRRLKNAGLKELAKEVLGREIKKPKKVTMSRWDSEWLTSFQVQYACVDAVVSFEIGRRLNVGV